MAANLHIETPLGLKIFGVPGYGTIGVYMVGETKQVTVVIRSACGHVLYVNPNMLVKIMGAVSRLYNSSDSEGYEWASWFSSKDCTTPAVFRLQKRTHPNGRIG
jgi:hypothetical protein